METLRPPQKNVGVFVFTLAGWAHGTLHIPIVKDLLGYLNSQVELLKLTDVMLPGAKLVQPFLALHKSAALLVIPEQGTEAVPGDPGIRDRGQHPVTCLLSHGSILGHLKLSKGMRTSDFLLRNSGFIELSLCHMASTPTLDPDQAGERTWPLVLVNSQGILGVTEQGR